MRTWPVVVFIGALTVSMPASLAAHHGSAAFDSGKMVVLKGTVAGWLYSNPHCLLTVDVKNDYVQTHVALQENLDPADLQQEYDVLTARAAEALSKEGFAQADHVFVRTADVRYFGQAFEVRVGVPDGPVTEDTLATVAERFHAEHRVLYGYDFSGDASQQVEVVNLRVSEIGRAHV